MCIWYGLHVGLFEQRDDHSFLSTNIDTAERCYGKTVSEERRLYKLRPYGYRYLPVSVRAPSLYLEVPPQKSHESAPPHCQDDHNEYSYVIALSLATAAVVRIYPAMGAESYSVNKSKIPTNFVRPSWHLSCSSAHPHTVFAMLSAHFSKW